MRLDSALAHTVDNLLKVSPQFARHLLELRDSMAGQPGAQHFEATRSFRAESWCWRHERPLTVCHRADELCTGESIPVNDPTGEAAVSNDPARAEHKELSKLILRMERDSNRLLDMIRARSDARPVSDRGGIGECSDCHRYCDGRSLRLSAYRGTEPVCPACRGARDRKAQSMAGMDGKGSRRAPAAL